MNSWDDLAAKYGGGATQTDDWESLAKRFAAQPRSAPEKPKAEPVTNFIGNLRLGPLDTGIPLPEWVNKRLAQLGSGFADMGLGIRQIAGRATSADADEKRRRDAALNDDLTGKALNFTGKVLPSFAVPYAAGAPVLSGIGAGAAIGAVEPVGTGESRARNTAFGAALGGAIPGVVNLIGRAAKPDAAVQATAALADRYGIPYSPGNVSGNAVVKAAQSLSNDIPIIGTPGRRFAESQQEAFNRAVGSTFGASANRLTPDVVGPAKQRMSAEFDRIWKNNNLTVDGQMFQELQALRASALDLPTEQSRRVIEKIDDFWKKAQPGPNNSPVVPGEVANNFQKWLRETGSSNQSALAQDAASLRRTILDGFNRSNPNEAAALTQNRAQWKAFKTVEPLLDKGEVGTAGRLAGDVPYTLLPEAVRNSYNGLSSAASTPPLAELARVGSTLLADRVQRTGGSARAMLQNGGLLTAGGAGTYSATTGDFVSPLIAVGTGLLGNAALNSPRLGRAIAGTNSARGLLGPSSIGSASEEAIRLALERSPLAALALMSPALE